MYLAADVLPSGGLGYFLQLAMTACSVNHSKMLAYAGILANPGRSPEIVCTLVAHCFDLNLSDVTPQNWQRRDGG
ncbi:type VI secretion system baseplate subunit TssG [Salmonella enterica subsp. enterica]|nr:type VI secretion system baseplate subunit TssG [Salmonella enterica subsp. enterica]